MEEKQKSQYDFEDAVRTTARHLWNEAALGGAGKLDDRERDGIFETPEVVLIVEATVSNRKQKALDDGQKTHELVLKIRKSGEKFAKGWLVTKDEPTADQRDAVKKFSSTTVIMSFDQFRSKLFRGADYLKLRNSYRFESIQDFVDDTIHVPESEFVPTDFIDASRTNAIPHKEILDWSVGDDRRRILIIGEYGSGKSMSLREAYISRRNAYQVGHLHRCPIYLNLREHTGQNSPVEALERHARSIGYPGPATDLVRAWRAGFVDLILDGFDEMATAGWGGSLLKVRSHRFAGMALIRNFISETPKHSDVYIAGRENFFDSMSEMRLALGVGTTFHVVRTAEFGSDELKLFLKRKKFSGTFPSWLPARPLLISYLLSKGLLVGMGAASSQLDEPTGWDHLLDMIAQREAAQDQRLEPQSVRRLIERLSTLARSTVDGLGNLDVTAIQAAFQAEAGFAADEGSAQLLLRLPGLAPSSKEDGTRRFVDSSLSNVAKAGDVFRFVQHPYDQSIDVFAGVISGIGSLGNAVLSLKIQNGNISVAQIVRSIEVASNSDDSTQICAELIQSVLSCGEDLTVPHLTIRSMSEEEINFHIGEPILKNVTFKDCLFGSLNIESGYEFADLPQFVDCVIGSVTGVMTRESIPIRMAESEVGELADEATTNAQVLAASLPEAQKVLISVLRKLFLQPGAGRQESAFYRGAMNARSKALVPEVLEKVRQFNFAAPSKLRGKEVWHPNRSLSSEARRIVFSPASKDHYLVRAVLEI